MDSQTNTIQIYACQEIDKKTLLIIRNNKGNAKKILKVDKKCERKLNFNLKNIWRV